MSTTKMDGHGRVTLPAALRRSLGLRPNSELAVEIEGGRIVLTPSDEGWARMAALFREARPDAPVVEELIAERRADTRRDRA